MSNEHEDGPVRTIGFIGSGSIGSTLARLAVAAGYDVVMSNSRGPETLGDLATELGPHARAADVPSAAAAGDVVVVTIPLYAIHSLPADAFTGKLVVDTCNYYPGRDGEIQELEEETITTSELVQRHLVGATVVKGFNNLGFRSLGTLARTTGDPDRTALPIAGDDERAKATVIELLDSLGYDSLDAGPLAEGWRFQRDTPVYVQPYAEGRPVGVAIVRTLLAEARRYRDM